MKVSMVLTARIIFHLYFVSVFFFFNFTQQYDLNKGFHLIRAKEAPACRVRQSSQSPWACILEHFGRIINAWFPTEVQIYSKLQHIAA